MVDTGTDTEYATAISGDNETDIYNCRIFDNDGGVVLVANTAAIHNSQFYRNNNEYGVNIDGAAAGSGDITIEHCDFFSNNGGIRLQNNDGTNEIVKNCIIHNNDNYGVYADTEITLTYSVISDSYSGMAIGASTYLANPLYVNEGAADPDDIDLNIKTIIAGDTANSAAKDLADDSRNSGSCNVAYIGAASTWTEITVPKPKIDFDMELVGGAVNKNRDGSVKSSKTGESLYCQMLWEGVSKTYAEYIITMLISSTSEVRIYFNPTTEASTYQTFYVLKNAKTGVSPKWWMHSDDGINSLSVQFARKYEE